MSQLNSHHIAVLNALNEHTQPAGERCVPFRRLENATGLDRARVRRSCRFLARKGYAGYHKALWYEDGGPAGAGYCISVEGRKWLDAAQPTGNHWSDCAVHNEPAFPAGPCNCGADAP